jgi:predicted amidohydrolase
MTIRIGVAQVETVPDDVPGNRQKALALAGEGLERGADIILFPEGMLTGYVRKFKQLAEPADGPTAGAFRALLRGSHTRVLYGLVEREADRLYEAAVLVGGEGILAHYRKTHLWWDATGARKETDHLTAGDKLVTFEVNGAKSGVMICYDGDFPEMTRTYANLGCLLLFWLNMRGSRGHAEVVDLARRNSMVMAVSCNCGKDEAGRTCRGGSNITDKDGSLLAEVWDKPGLILADVDPSGVLAARANNPLYRGRRPELYT